MGLTKRIPVLKTQLIQSPLMLAGECAVYTTITSSAEVSQLLHHLQSHWVLDSDILCPDSLITATEVKGIGGAPVKIKPLSVRRPSHKTGKGSQ